MSSTEGSSTITGGEAPGQRRVALDLAVLGQRRRADHPQLAAGQHRLEHVGGVHRALGRAGAEHGVQLVDEQDDLTVGGDDLLEQRPSAAARTRRGTGCRRPCRPRSSATTRTPRSGSGTSSSAMRRARPSAIAVLPTPASPISAALFLRRRLRASTTCSISCSRPITGSIRPVAGLGGQVTAELVEGGVCGAAAVCCAGARAGPPGDRAGAGEPGSPDSRRRCCWCHRVAGALLADSAVAALAAGHERHRRGRRPLATREKMRSTPALVLVVLVLKFHCSRLSDPAQI